MLVCFASEKGGAGKTTLAAILAERLHTLDGAGAHEERDPLPRHAAGDEHERG